MHFCMRTRMYMYLRAHMYICISDVHVHPRFIEGNIYGAYVLHEMRFEFASELDLQLNICTSYIHIWRVPYIYETRMDDSAICSLSTCVCLCVCTAT